MNKKISEKKVKSLLTNCGDYLSLCTLKLVYYNEEIYYYLKEDSRKRLIEMVIPSQGKVYTFNI